MDRVIIEASDFILSDSCLMYIINMVRCIINSYYNLDITIMFKSSYHRVVIIEINFIVLEYLLVYFHTSSSYFITTIITITIDTNQLILINIVMYSIITITIDSV